MGYWQRARRKEIQALLEVFDSHGWRIEDPPVYYTVKCPCHEQHMRWIHLTPSGSRYVNNVTAWLKRQPCTKETP